MAIQAQLADGRILEFPDGTNPAVIQRTVKTVLGQSVDEPVAAETPGEFAQTFIPRTKSILDVPAQGAPAPTDELIGVDPNFVKGVKAQLDAAAPDKREGIISSLQKRGGVYGRVASSIADQYKKLDQLPEQYKSLSGDMRAENQAAKFVAQGMTPDTAQTAAVSQALAQSPLVIPELKPETQEYIETRERYAYKPGMSPFEETVTSLLRGGAKAGAGIAQSGGGINRFVGDMAGFDTTDTAKTLDKLNAFTENMGAAKNKPLEYLESAASSVAQQLPALFGGAITGSEALVLGSMFLNSFGQTYDDSRRQKLDLADATARSAMFAALEVAGEKLGLGDTIKGIKAAAKGVSTPELAKYFGKALAKEIPGEELTYAGQFAVDKGYGINPEAGIEDFIKGAADTMAVTLLQGGMMMGGGAAVSKAVRKVGDITGRAPEQIYDYQALAKEKGFLAQPGVKAPEQAVPEQPAPEAPVQPPVQPPTQAAEPPIQPPAQAPSLTVPAEEFEAPEEVTPVAPKAVAAPVEVPAEPTAVEPEAVQPEVKPEVEAPAPAPSVPVSAPAPVEAPKAEAPVEAPAEAPIVIPKLEELKRQWTEAAKAGDQEATRRINDQIVALKREQATTVAPPVAVTAPVAEAPTVEPVKEPEAPTAPKVTEAPQDDLVTEQLNRIRSRDFGLPRPVSGTGAQGIAIAKQQNEARDAAYDAAVKEFLQGPLDVKKPVKKEEGVNLERVTDVAPQPIKKTNTVSKTPEGVMKTLWSITPKEDIRYYLKGIKLERDKGNAIATDGHRLVAVSGVNFEGWPAPPSAKIVGDQVLGRDGNYIPDSNYPKWESVVPKEHAQKPERFGTSALGDYARGVEKAWSYTGSKMGAPLRLQIGDKQINFQANYIADLTDTFQKLGYNTFDASFSDKGQLYATSPDGKVRQVVMPLRGDTSPFRVISNKAAPAVKPKEKVATDVADVLKSIETAKKEAQGNADWVGELDRLAEDVKNKFITPRQAKAAINRIAVRHAEVTEEEEPEVKKPEAKAEAPVEEVTEEIKPVKTEDKNVIGVLPNGETQVYREQKGLTAGDKVTWVPIGNKNAVTGSIDRIQDSFDKKSYLVQVTDQAGKQHIVDINIVQKLEEKPIVNKKKPDAALPAGERLIIMPCSDMKDTKAGPAIDLYKGVFFQTLKKNAQEGGMPNVIIVSAKHGVINADERIEPYDQKMTPEQADTLIGTLDDQLKGLKIPMVKDVLIVGGKEYQRVMRETVSRLMDKGVIAKDASINATEGGIGDQRKQLREYLDAIEVPEKAEEKPVKKEPAAKPADYTPEQRAQAQVIADVYGGEIAWQKGDMALIRAYAKFTGDPVYLLTVGSIYAKRDIEVSEYTFNGVVTPELKKKLVGIRTRLEKEAQRKHEDQPFIVFDRGVKLSNDIPESIGNVVRGWKDLLKLDAPIYVSTTEDAKANRDNFTGPHRRIGSGTLNENDRGSMRRMPDGSYYILFSKDASNVRMLETIAHEMGHLHQALYFDQASPEEKKALEDAHARWVEKQKNKSSKDVVKALRSRGVGKVTKVTTEELDSYWTSFKEWYADQTSRWAVSAERPVSIVEKFFKRLGNQLRLFYQRITNQGYLPDETFAKYIEKSIKTPVAFDQEVQDQRNIDKESRMSTPDQVGFDFDDEEVAKVVTKNNPTTAKVLNKANELPGVRKKLPPGRSPELAAAAAQVKNGTMSSSEYDRLVNKYKPIPLYAEPMKPATSDQVFNALDTGKRGKIDPSISSGTQVGLRLDIPAFNRHGVFVVSIHAKRTPSAAGSVIGYGSVGNIRNVTFAVGNQKKALSIATGESKDVLQTMEGSWVPYSPEQTYQRAREVFNNPAWVQVGIDPTRHAYFYDRRTTQPVVAADEVIQVGNMILAKGVTYGTKEDFLFDIDPTAQSDEPSASQMSKENRKDMIAEYSKLRRERTGLIAKVKKGGASIDLQRKLTLVDELAGELRQEIEATKPRLDSPEAFLARALKAYDDGDISADVLAVINSAYNKQPELLNGLKLSVKEGPQRGVAGAFDPINRVVMLYKQTAGTRNEGTIQHELTHSLEQMMNREQRVKVIEAWAKSLQRAIKNNPDETHQRFFSAVLDFIDNPSEKTLRKATSLLPDYSFYQYVNPSEYWAVNASTLMGQQLGPAWERFKKALRQMLEGLKAVFGMDNKYAVHKVFNQVMRGEKVRLDQGTLVQLASASNSKFGFLEDIEDAKDLIDKHNRPKTPMIDATPVRTYLVKQKEASKEFFKDAMEDPNAAIDTVFTRVNRGLLKMRNKNIWYGSALNAADTLRYNNDVRTANKTATASLALDNAIRGGHLASEVVFLGGLEFNEKALVFTAVKRDKGMFGVYEAEKRIKDLLGDQLGTDIVQGYLEAKRSRSIENEYLYRQAEYESLREEQGHITGRYKEAKKGNDTELVDKLERQLEQIDAETAEAKDALDSIKVAREKINMTEDEVDDFIKLDKEYPDLREIMDNYTAVNQNLLKVWKSVGLISNDRYQKLAGIKDYVPWQRIMNDEDDVHSPVQATTRSRANIGKEKLFKSGKPTNVTTFTVQNGQQTYKIQPTSALKVEVNDQVLSPDMYTAEPNGKITINIPLNDGDEIVFTGNREIENIIDNMTRNVMRMTMNAVSQYAANTIVREYATRTSDGKVRTFAKPDQEKGRFNFIANGRRVVVEVKDPLIAESIFGQKALRLSVLDPLQAGANILRRTITVDPIFQLIQVFKDAPTAALITGVKHPFLLIGGVYTSFLKALAAPAVRAGGKLVGKDIEIAPALQILRAAGIGGYYQNTRTAEAEVKRRLGIINNSVISMVGRTLDYIGDSSDYAQRMAVYDRIMKETGDEALAMYQAANVMNFLRRGSGQTAQILTKTVPFLNAYAQSIDVLFQSMAGGGLKGKSRKEAMARIATTGMLLAGLTLVYCMLVGDDDEYNKLDDQTKVRNFYIPGAKLLLPISTGASFFFKALPELVYNAFINEASKDEMDSKRLRTALKEAAIDTLAGPTPLPSAIKPIVEISLNHDFFTKRKITPDRLEKVDPQEQYTGATSEAAKTISRLLSVGDKAVLNPIEADHLIRGLFGTAGALVQWASNNIGEAAKERPAPDKRETPLVGRFFAPEVARGHEDWFYDFRDDIEKKWNTYQRKVERVKMQEATDYFNENQVQLGYHFYVQTLQTSLQNANERIRMFESSTDPSLTPEVRRQGINDAKIEKQMVLQDIAKMRKQAEEEEEKVKELLKSGK